MEEPEERWLCGDELRVSGDVVLEVKMEEGDAERRELRVGLKAVLRRRREPDVLRRGVKDWKRLVRLGEGILSGVEVVVVTSELRLVELLFSGDGCYDVASRYCLSEYRRGVFVGVRLQMKDVSNRKFQLSLRRR